MQSLYPTISAIIITKNNAKTIERCLQSVCFADEIVVLDSGSTDATLDICRQYTQFIFQTDWPGFGPQKNRALQKATSDWILSIDSDEWVSDALQIEIQEIIRQSLSCRDTPLIFSMPRRNQYAGQWIRFGDVGKDRVTRLFKRGEARFTDNMVHEYVITKHTVYLLQSPLLHFAYASMDECIKRLRWYANLSAEMRFQQGKKSSGLRGCVSAAWSFIRSYLLRYGFLDGRLGWMISVAFAKSSYWRHTLLRQLHQK